MRELKIPKHIADQMLSAPPTTDVGQKNNVIPASVFDLFEKSKQNLSEVGPVYTPYEANQYGLDKPVDAMEEIGTFESAYNNFMTAKDAMELDMWKGMKLKSEQDPNGVYAMIKGAMKDMGNPSFFENRIKANEEDIIQQQKRIIEDPKAGEFNFTDAFADPKSFFGTQLPTMMGGMAGLMAEPLAASAIVAYGAGMLTGGSEIATITAAGIAAIAMSRPFESLSEGYASYDDTKRALTEVNTKNNLGLTPEEIETKSLQAFNDTYSSNMALSLADGAEVAVALIPLAKFAKPMINSVGTIGKIARRIDMFSKSHPFIEAAIKAGAISQKEGFEELYQFKKSSEAYNKATQDQRQYIQDRPDTWARVFESKEAMAGYKGGLFGGVSMGGAAPVIRGAMKAMNIVKDDLDTQPFSNIKEKQTVLRGNLIANAVINGREVALQESINIFGKTGLLTNVETNDKDSAKKSSIAEAKKLGDWAAEKSTLFKSYVERYPNLPQSSVTKIFTNGLLNDDYTAQLKSLNPEKVEDIPIIKDLENKIFALNLENSNIISGKPAVEAVISEEKEPVNVNSITKNNQEEDTDEINDIEIVSQEDNKNAKPVASKKQKPLIKHLTDNPDKNKGTVVGVKYGKEDDKIAYYVEYQDGDTTQQAKIASSSQADITNLNTGEKEKIGKFGLAAKDFEGKEVEMKVVNDGEIDASGNKWDGSIINDFTQKPYGPKIEVWAADKFIGNIQVTNFNKKKVNPKQLGKRAMTSTVAQKLIDGNELNNAEKEFYSNNAKTVDNKQKKLKKAIIINAKKEDKQDAVIKEEEKNKVKKKIKKILQQQKKDKKPGKKKLSRKAKKKVAKIIATEETVIQKDNVTVTTSTQSPVRDFVEEKTEPTKKQPEPNDVTDDDLGNIVITSQTSIEKGIEFLDELEKKLKEKKKSQGNSRNLGSFANFTSTDVELLAVQLAKQVLKGLKTLQEAYKELKNAVFQSKKMDRAEKQKMYSWVDRFNKMMENSMQDVGNRGAEASKNLDFLKELSDVSEQEIIENAMTFSADKRMAWMGEKVKGVWTGKNADGTPTIIRSNSGDILPMDTRVSILVKHAKEYKSGSLKDHYAKLQEIELRNEVLKNPEPMLESAHNYLSSINESIFVWTGNNFDNNSRFGINISNQNVASKQLESIFKQLFSRHFRTIKNKINEQGQVEETNAEKYKELWKEFNSISSAIRNKIGNAIKAKQARPDLVDELINTEAEFLNRLTGIDSKYFVFLANDETKFRYRKDVQEKSAWDFYKTSSNTVLSQFLLTSKANPFINIAKNNSAIQSFEESFTKGIFSPSKNAYINQFKVLSTVAAMQQGQTIAHSFYGVNKKFKSGIIFKSGLSVDVDRLNNDPSIWDGVRTKILDKSKNYISNPWTASRKGKQTKIIYLDGTKNVNTNSSLSADEMSPTDIMLNELVMYLEGSQITKEQGTYLQFIEQQADDGNKMYLPAKQYTLAEAKAAADKLHNESAYNFRSSAEILKDASTVQNRLAQYANQFKLKPGQTLKATVEEFILNYEINKFLISEYLQPRYYKQGNKVAENFKEYLSGKVKRKRDGKGIAFMERVVDMLPGKKIRQVVWSDPVSTITVGKEIFGNTELTDGFILVSEEMGKTMQKASGAMYNWHGSFKTTYNKVNDDKSITFNKANSVVLPKELADTSLTLKVVYDYMQKNNIHFLAFKSGVKQFDTKKVIKPQWSYENNNAILTKAPIFNENQIENIDPQYYVLQQDLQYSTQLKERNITKQLKYYLLQLPNGNTIVEKLNAVSDTFKNKIEKEFFGKTDQDKVDWLLSKLPEKPENWHIKNLLTHSASNLYNPKIQGKINSIFAREVEQKVLNLITNGSITIEAPNFGIQLESFVKGLTGSDNTFSEAMVPIGYNTKSGIQVGDEIIITRVPTTDLHSISVVKVNGFLPESMGSVIMTNQGIQKIAGADNDGDARYIWAKFSDAKEGSPEKLANEIFDLIVSDYKNPDNYDKITRPINTAAARSFLGTAINEDKSLPHHSLLSSIKAMMNNQEGQAVIGILARFNAVYNYAVKAGFKINEIMFPVFDRDGNFKTTKAVSEWKENDEVRFVLSNNLNHATDNPKEGLLEYLGLTKSTAMAKSLAIALGISDEDATRFFNTEIIQEVIAEARKVESPYNNDDYTAIFSNVQAKYISQLSEQEQDYYAQRTMKEKAFIKETNLKTAKGKIELLQFYQYFNSIANDIYKINTVAKLLEESPKTFGEYYAAKNSYNSLVENKLKIDIGTLLKSNLWQIVRDNLAISEKKFANSIMNTKQAKAILNSIESDFKSVINNKSFKLTDEQVNTLEKAINDYMVIEALQTTESKEELREMVIDWYDSLDVTRQPGKILSEAFYIDSKNKRLELSQQFRNINTNNSHVPTFLNAFTALGKMEKNMLLKYHAKEFGNNENNEYRGGFGFMFDAITETGLQNKINNSKKILWEKEAKISNIKKQILLNNPELIPTAKWKKDSNSLVLVDTYNNPLKELPLFVKSTVKGKTIIFVRHMVGNKMGYENNSNSFNGNFFANQNKEGYTYDDKINNNSFQQFQQSLNKPNTNPILQGNQTNVEEIITQLEKDGVLEIDCKGKLKAEKGLVTSFVKGGKWKVIKDLKGYPTHKEGGVDLTIGKNGVTIKNGNTQFTAKYGLVIPKN